MAYNSGRQTEPDIMITLDSINDDLNDDDAMLDQEETELESLTLPKPGTVNTDLLELLRKRVLLVYPFGLDLMSHHVISDMIRQSNEVKMNFINRRDERTGQLERTGYLIIHFASLTAATVAKETIESLHLRDDLVARFLDEKEQENKAMDTWRVACVNKSCGVMENLLIVRNIPEELTEDALKDALPGSEDILFAFPPQNSSHIVSRQRFAYVIFADTKSMSNCMARPAPVIDGYKLRLIKYTPPQPIPKGLKNMKLRYRLLYQIDLVNKFIASVAGDKASSKIVKKCKFHMHRYELQQTADNAARVAVGLSTPSFEDMLQIARLRDSLDMSKVWDPSTDPLVTGIPRPTNGHDSMDISETETPATNAGATEATGPVPMKSGGMNPMMAAMFGVNPMAAFFQQMAQQASGVNPMAAMAQQMSQAGNVANPMSAMWANMAAAAAGMAAPSSATASATAGVPATGGAKGASPRAQSKNNRKRNKKARIAGQQTANPSSSQAGSLVDVHTGVPVSEPQSKKQNYAGSDPQLVPDGGQSTSQPHLYSSFVPAGTEPQVISQIAKSNKKKNKNKKKNPAQQPQQQQQSMNQTNSNLMSLANMMSGASQYPGADQMFAWPGFGGAYGGGYGMGDMSSFGAQGGSYGGQGSGGQGGSQRNKPGLYGSLAGQSGNRNNRNY